MCVDIRSSFSCKYSSMRCFNESSVSGHSLGDVSIRFVSWIGSVRFRVAFVPCLRKEAKDERYLCDTPAFRFESSWSSLRCAAQTVSRLTDLRIVDVTLNGEKRRRSNSFTSLQNVDKPFASSFWFWLSSFVSFRSVCEAQRRRRSSSSCSSGLFPRCSTNFIGAAPNEWTTQEQNSANNNRSVVSRRTNERSMCYANCPPRWFFSYSSLNIIQRDFRADLSLVALPFQSPRPIIDSFRRWIWFFFFFSVLRDFPSSFLFLFGIDNGADRTGFLQVARRSFRLFWLVVFLLFVFVAVWLIDCYCERRRKNVDWSDGRERD